MKNLHRLALWSYHFDETGSKRMPLRRHSVRQISTVTFRIAFLMYPGAVLGTSCRRLILRGLKMAMGLSSQTCLLLISFSCSFLSYSMVQPFRLCQRGSSQLVSKFFIFFEVLQYFTDWAELHVHGLGGHTIQNCASTRPIASC